jgi:3-dehydroquinate synthetase
VQVDAATLDTLGGLDYAAGLAEVVKVALAVDPELLVHLESHREALAVQPRGRQWASGRAAREAAIVGAVQAKIDVVARDEREEGERAVLNFGHTLGHCVEHASGYRLRHGMAVAAGMAAALEVGVRLGVTPTELRDRALALLRGLGLPLRARVPREAAREALGHDKKRVGRRLRFVLLRGVGDAALVEVPEAEALSALDGMLENG